MNYRRCPRCSGSGFVADARMKLTDEDVDAIRILLAKGVKGVDLAKDYEVSETMISRIRNRKERT